MIPPFDEHGYLPPGVHQAKLEEIEARFGLESELRRVQMESLHWLVDFARPAGVMRLIINGSFVTDVVESNDVDCVLRIGPDFPSDSDAELELINGLPFLHIDLVREEGFRDLVERVYATDRDEVPKGMIEVVSWS
jgi:uncharacterized protein DUF6932